jgi:hypothetical protein
MHRRLAWAAALACVVLAACGEKPQTSGTRKADAAPSQGAVAAYTAPGWKAGDATSWEAQMKKRSEGQNEYTRTVRK